MGVGGDDVRLRLAHRGAGQGLLGAQPVQRRGGRGHLGLGERQVTFGAGDPRGVFLRVKADQGLAGLDLLVVGHQHLGHQPLHPRCDGRAVGLQIGVVGAHRRRRRLQPHHPADGQDGGDADDDQHPAGGRPAPGLQLHHAGAHANRVFQGRGAHWSNTSRVEVADA